jgi:hypothetical protein
MTDTAVVGRMSPLRQTTLCLLLAACCVFVYEITAYGGIRSPDSEVMFRTSEALVTRGSFAIERGLETWRGFGLARGVDGKEYSIFGPAQALVAAPLVAAGRRLADTGFFRDNTFPLPLSHYIDNGIGRFVTNQPAAARDESAVRWVAAQLNVVISALSVVLVYLVARRLVGNSASSLFTAVIYGFGTLVWPYSGTFFSEPLASLCALTAFGLLLANDPRFGTPSPKVLKTLLAGACLGTAAAAHITAILFAPFFFLYALHPYLDARNRREALAPAFGFAAGLGTVLLLLGYYNYIRFGSPLETGRGLDPSGAALFAYGVFTSPIEGLHGLLISSNKGLLLFSPVVVVAALAWPRLHRLHPFLSNVLASAIVFRILFIASRSDWHGGFCLGPRYLLMILPYICLPFVLLVKDVFQGGLRGRFVLVTSCWLFICQQYYFALGEIFSYYHVRRWQALSKGVDIFAGHRIYFEWANNPLTSLLDGFRGPFLLRQLPIGNYLLFVLGCAVLGVAVVLICTIFPSAASVVEAREPQPGVRHAANG